ncbi:protein kinase [Cryptosporidium canis]|uniref:Protein kinase n=1 Tax=Cryptosporidium canis TaxID=195482 RepID=A0A9D5HVT1_9CRYT|nr:protein kinase [Cryptosporidium canis]
MSESSQQYQHQQNGQSSTFLGQSGVGYKLCDRLGAGSASVVFKCKSVGKVREDGIMVPIKEEYFAVKIIDMKSIYLTPDFEEKKSKLLEEAMILHKLRHPNIVSLVDFSDSGDTFYLVMDLVRGGELFYKIVECGSLSESSTRFILKQVVEALIYMHQKEIIHRDLKPENILIDRSLPGDYFLIKVADFGVAKFLRQGYTQARTLVGTPQYWAPEVLNASNTGESYGTEADLWSLGVLFYVMLGGAFPFDERKGNLERLIREGNYHFRYPRFKRVSEQAKQLIRRLLTVDPGQRMTLSELKQDPWMNIKSENEPSILEIQKGVSSSVPERSEIVLFKSVDENAELSSAGVAISPEESEEDGQAGRPSSSISANASRASSIMDINGLLDLQLSVAYKLHGIYIAFRHNSATCRIIRQHIHKWRILQQRSYVAIGKFKQTCESVLDELPDFLLAVNTNEPKLAIELLSHVKNLVDVTQNDVEDIQNSYNDFLFELSNFVESVRDIKRITERNARNISCESLKEESELVPSFAVGRSASCSQRWSDKEGDGRLCGALEGLDLDSSNSSCFDRAGSGVGRLSKSGSVFSRGDGSHGTGFSNHAHNLMRNEFDPSIFIGYNSARERVIRRITDLFSNSEIGALFEHLDKDDDSNPIKTSGGITIIHNQREVDKSQSNLTSSLSIQVRGKTQYPPSSSYITTSLASTRDLLLDFLFLPASICNVPPTGVESLLQEGVDFGLPNLPSFEASIEKLSSFGGDYEEENEKERRIKSGESERAKKSSGGGAGASENFSGDGESNRANYTEKLGSVVLVERNGRGGASCGSGRTGDRGMEEAGFGSETESGLLGKSSNKCRCAVSGSSSSSSIICDQNAVKRRSEDQLKISYILLRVLAQLRMIESILGRCVAFWGNMNIMIEKILQLRQHAERLLGFTGNPVLRTRFDERVESYREFWKELRDMCDSYLRSSQIRQMSLENQVHELLDTASKVDTVFNMSMM